MSRHSALYQGGSISVLDEPGEIEQFSGDAILEIIKKKRLRPQETAMRAAYEIEQGIGRGGVLSAWKAQKKKKIPIMEPFGPSEGQIQRAVLEYQRHMAARAQEETTMAGNQSSRKKLSPLSLKGKTKITGRKGSESSPIPNNPVVEIISDDTELSDDAVTDHKKRLQPTKSRIGLKLFEDSYSDLSEDSSAEEEEEDVDDIQDSSSSQDEDYQDPSLFSSKRNSKRAVDGYGTDFVIDDDEVVWNSSADDVLEDCEAILMRKENAKKAEKALNTKKRNFPHTPPTPPHKTSDTDYDGEVNTLHIEAPPKRNRLLRIQTSSDQEDIDDDLDDDPKNKTVTTPHNPSRSFLRFILNSSPS